MTKAATNTPLPKPLRSQLEATVKAARDVAEKAAGAALAQPPIPVYPHVYPPESPNQETQHPCGFPADRSEQVQNLE
jgi:hypothetical protein